MVIMSVPIFAADDEATLNGGTPCSLEEAFANAMEDGDIIELLTDARITMEADACVYAKLTVRMHGHTITIDDGVELAVIGAANFENGTIVGSLKIDVSDPDDYEVTLTAPADADCAIDGSVSIIDGALKVSGAKVGINGTINRIDELIDISGTESAVRLTSDPGFYAEGSTEADGTAMSKAVFSGDTYTVGGETAKRIRAGRSITDPGGSVVNTIEISPETQTVYPGQPAVFDLTYIGEAKDLKAYVQDSANPSKFTVTVSDDKKVTVTAIEPIPQGKSYTLWVHETGDAFVKAKATLVPCSHTDLDENNNCTVCNAHIVAEVNIHNRDNWSDKKVYRCETLDEAVAAIPDYSEAPFREDGTLQYQYTLLMLESIELDHDLIVKDKPFNLTTYQEEYPLTFTGEHSMKISRSVEAKENVVYFYNVYEIGSVTLEEMGAAKNQSRATIKKLILADKTADISGLEDVPWQAMFKIERLEVTAPGCTIGDFLVNNIALMHYDPDYNDYIAGYVGNTLTSADYVVVQEAPVKDFTVALDASSEDVFYPSDVIINADYDSDYSVNLTPTGYPQGSTYDAEGKKITFHNLPVGTHKIGITAKCAGFEITKYVTVTVKTRSIEDNDSIKILINKCGAPYGIPYARGEQDITVNIYDGNNNDITPYFDITGDLKVTNVGSYEVTITAKEGSGFEGKKVVHFTVKPIHSVENTDFEIVLPSSFKYDGMPKSITVNELNGSGVHATSIMYTKNTDPTPLPGAPTEPGDYMAGITFDGAANYKNKTIIHYFTIEKADVEFEYTTPFKSWYSYEDDKKIAGRITCKDASAVNAKTPTGKISIRGSNISGSIAIPEFEAKLSDDGSFEFDLPKLIADEEYIFVLSYSGDDCYNKLRLGDYGCNVGKVQLNSFAVSDTEYRYSPGVERTITVSAPDTSKLTNSDFDVKYYLVDENSGTLASTEPVSKAISAGRYLYVISLKSEHEGGYKLASEYKVDGKTDIPDMSAYINVGFMDIKASSDFSQKPISFARGVINAKSGETFTNTLNNDNASVITYVSSDTEVAEVDTNGTVTAKKSGTATITATSAMDGATPVYASCTVNVKKELTKDDFDITAEEKTYNGTKTAVVNAVLVNKEDANDIVKAEITAEFDSADAGDRIVSYEITGLSGRDAEKYVLTDSVRKLAGTMKGKINKAPVTVICAKTTTRTFDGTEQTVNVSAMANGMIFDAYTVQYGGHESAVDVGEYEISIVLTPEADKNYTVLPFEAKLIITNAVQDVFSIENVPENVYYGDSFKISANGANGDVTYSITEGSDIAELDGDGNVTIKGVGRVTITAVSEKAGYSSRTAYKTFAAKAKILTPSASAVNRVYDGTSGVEVNVSFENGANVTAAAVGTMINPDAGKGKIVYVSGITLSDSEHYTLSTSNVQTTVDIEPAEIKGFEISPSDKKYDGTVSAIAAVSKIDGVFESDLGFVGIDGTAEFDSADAGDRTVTFKANALTGLKAANYKLAPGMSASKSAKIQQLKINFTVGQTAFVYDGGEKNINVSATDENGRVFNGFTVEYPSGIPRNAGDYTAKIVLGSNYIADPDPGDISIKVSEATQTQLVISGIPGTVEYGDTFKLEAFGGAADGVLSWNVTGNADITADGEVTITGIGKIEIEAVKKSENYNDVTAKAVFNATAKNVTFELDNLEQTYGKVTDVIVKPGEPGVDYDISYGGGAALPENAGKYKVTVTAKGPNYRGSASDTLVINKASAAGEIVMDSSFTYGDNAVSASVINNPQGTNAEITYAGTGIYIPQSAAPVNAGTYTAIATVSGANYETLTVTKSFKIEKAQLKVKAKDCKRSYGEANPVFELEYDGFKNNDTKDCLLYEPAAVCGANASSPVGKYDIAVSGGYGENYEFIYDSTGVLEITGTTGGSFYITGSPNSVYVNDVFTLNAFYGNTKVDAEWKSSDPAIAEIDANGNVTAKKAGTVTITASAGKNYGDTAAEFVLTVKQSGITLVPSGLVKTYNGKRQDISFEQVQGFTPVIGENVEVKYTLISDASVTEPVEAGTYSVTYTVVDGSYTGGGTAIMYINKADAELSPKNVTKIYGDKAKFALETNSPFVTDERLLQIAENTVFTSDGADEKANTGEYDITAVLGNVSDKNLNFIIGGTGKLTVEKAPLTVTVKKAVREYGAENPEPEAEFTGFKNGDTADGLSGELSFTYADEINADTPVGPYYEKITASGLSSDNYDIEYKPGDVEVTKIKVTPGTGSAGTASVTVIFDKEIPGLAAENFIVTNGETSVTLTGVTPSEDNKSYKLSGSFAAGKSYTVTMQYTNDIYEIIGSALTFTVAKSGGSSGGGGGGGGGSVSSKLTVAFDSNGGSKTASQTVSRNTAAKEPEAPVKDGFVFAGWYADKELKTKYDFSEKVTKNITLYAAWEKADSTESRLILTIGSKEASVFGTLKSNDVAPKIVNSRTMLPARFVAENLGAEVLWDEEQELVTINGKNLKTGEDVTIIIKIDSDIAMVNGSEIKLDSAAFVENDRTYTPVRFISEELGASVEWLESEQKVIITKP